MKKKLCPAFLFVLAVFAFSSCSPSVVMQTTAGEFKTGALRPRADYSPEQIPASGTEFLAIPLVSDDEIDMTAVTNYFLVDNQTSLSANGNRGTLKFIAYECPKGHPEQVQPVLVFEVGESDDDNFYPMTIQVGGQTFEFS